MYKDGSLAFSQNQGGTAKMSLKIIEKRCKGCGICVEFCPKKVLIINEIEKVQIDKPEECIYCKQCELRCPDFAIFAQKEEG